MTTATAVGAHANAADLCFGAVSVRLGELVAALGGELLGAPDQQVTGLAPLDKAQAGQISFLADAKRAESLATSGAGCVILAPTLREAALARGGACILTEQPYLYYARLTQWWRQQQQRPRPPQIHPSAIVDPTAQIDPTAVIGPQCIVERGVRIGPGSVLTARVFVGWGCTLGARCLIQPGAVIGGDGFGFAPEATPEGQRWVRIEQMGAVVLGDDVEIGSNTSIDRGALEDTRIEDGVKLDNQIQVGHNTRVGRHSAAAGCVGIAGSADIGAYCTLGGAAMIGGHLKIVDHVHVSAATPVAGSILKPGLYSGLFPIAEHAVWEKNAATLRQLYAMRGRVKELERQLAALQARLARSEGDTL